MGCIGMSLDDFERCTPSEFYAAWKQWHEQMERMERSSWERTRTLALVYAQPYSKHALPRLFVAMPRRSSATD